MAKPMSPERIAEAEMLASGVAPTHKCEMCGHQGLEDPVVGCLRCGWDEMTPIPAASQDQGAGQMADLAIRYLHSQEWSMGNGQCPACHGMGPMVASFYPHRTERHGHREGCGLQAAILALSHAAGQEVVAWTDSRGRLREGKQELVSGTQSHADPVALYTYSAVDRSEGEES